MSFTLANGLLLHADNPDTFEIPSDADKTAIRPDDFVKLIFQQGGAMSERMWVLVTNVEGDKLRGTLGNHPCNIVGLGYGDEVAFSPEHVVTIMERE